MKNLELSDEQEAALIRFLRQTIDGDPYPLSPRVMVLKEILGKLRSEPALRPLRTPKVYVPPLSGRYRRRG